MAALAISLLFCSFLVLLTNASPAPMKKSFNMEDIASATNGAARLRYGKRGNIGGYDQELFDTMAKLTEVGKRGGDVDLYDSLYRLSEAGKRSELSSDRLSRIAESLSNVERPRFG